MIDPADKETQPIALEQPKRGRGRPATGAAMTPAEKQRAYRQRLAEQRANQGSSKYGEEQDERMLQVILNLEKQVQEAINRAELAEARADVMGNELAIAKAKLSKSVERRIKRHRDEPAIELKIED